MSHCWLPMVNHFAYSSFNCRFYNRTYSSYKIDKQTNEITFNNENDVLQ